MAGEVRGSEIVICTDGLANVGIGSLDSGIVATEVDQFYHQIGTYAKDKGVAVSVISIEGTDCKLEKLGVVSDMTNGEITTVDPLKIVNEFKSILSLPVIATNCNVTLKLHNGMFVRNEEDDTKKESRIEKEIGNVTSESAFTVEYGVRKKK